MRYTVVQSWTLEGMSEQVEPLLAVGWELQGGVSVAYYEQKTTDGQGYDDVSEIRLFAQALIKRGTNP